jgi:ubiquinone/menaquinone biosynthesis C-methylase UbiE
MNKNDKVCPAITTNVLDNYFRKIVQNPKKILKPYINKGMTVMDVGCGPGFFTLEMAKLLDKSGKVIAVDLQEGMLEKIKAKIKHTNLEERIILHKCQKESIGINEPIDFILVFWMVHEAPDSENLLKELISNLKTNGKILIVEPKIHVSKIKFEIMLEKIRGMEININRGPKIFFSRSIILTKRRN